jgi:hypothetical protein
MANEISIRASLQIRNGNCIYQSQPTAFIANQSKVGGPDPGMVVVPTTGADITFTGLTKVGMCRIVNLDTVSTLIVGLKVGSFFLPLMDVLPGEFYVVRLSQFLAQEVFGTGTGIAGSSTLHALATPSSLRAVFEGYEV